MDSSRLWQKKMITGGLFAAIICLLTFLIHVPITKGYIHPGDAAIYLGAFILGPLYGALAAGVGSALADLFAGYAVYIPVTFIIKSLMAVIVALWIRRVSDTASAKNVILPLSVAAAWMVAGYFIYEMAAFGFGVALVNLPFNLLQGVAGVLIAIPLINLGGKYKL
ncbi:MAG: ECF transporter S component [Bacillota bacterium]